MDEGLILVLVALISGGSGVAGSLLAGRQTISAQRRLADEAQRQRFWEAKRDAYLRLLRAVTQVESAAAGSLSSGRGPIRDTELTREMLAAEVEARMYAPDHVWERVEPTLRATALKANSLVPGFAAEAGRMLRDLRAETAEGSQRLYEEALAAIRQDLDE